MRHPEPWYAALAAELGHPGYVTMAETRQAEARECREIAATAKWTRHGDCYATTAAGGCYQVQRDRSQGGRTWIISAWPSGMGQERHVRRQPGIRTLAEAKSLALAMPCCKCGLASPLVLMERRMPARPTLADVITERWRCQDSPACLAERKRLTDGSEFYAWTAKAELILRNKVTGQQTPVIIDPADPAWQPACRNNLIRGL